MRMLPAHPHPATRLLASQTHFAKFLARHGHSAKAYHTGWRESLRVIEHNEDQKQTLFLLTHRRPLLEEKVSQLDAMIQQELRRGTKRYDFSSGEWVGP
jgi:hypothetical protein